MAANGYAEQDFGQLLRRYRKRAGATQRQLAELAAISVRAIRDLESGRVTQPRTQTATLLGNALRLDGMALTRFLDCARRTGRPLPGEATNGVFGSPPNAVGLVGRTTELRFALDRMAEHQRLVTITGVAGVGKTRFAVEVAQWLHAGGASTVRWAAPGDVAAQHPQDVLVGVGDRPAVLVLDGADGGKPVNGWLDWVLNTAPHVSVVATSRAPIGIPGECVVPLPPLPVPAAARSDGIADVASVRLFRTYVMQVGPGLRLRAADLPVVGEICRLVDGLPLAIEQAAIACLAESVEGLCRRLRADPFALPTTRAADGSGREIRQMLSDTLSALPVEARRLLPDLARIDGGWSVSEAAARLGRRADDLVVEIHALLMRGLLHCEADPFVPRFRVFGLARLLVTGMPGVRTTNLRAVK